MVFTLEYEILYLLTVPFFLDTELRSPPSKVMRRKEEPSTTCQDTSPFVVIWGLEDTSELVKVGICFL